MVKGRIVAGMVCVFLGLVGGVMADTFGTGANQFEIDFSDISNATNPGSGYGQVNYNYRIGIYEITNDQWNKFKSEDGKPSGNPATAYDKGAYWGGTNKPTNCVSWYEAAQFVNYLNVISGHHEAYNFTGTKGQSDYIFTIWDTSDAWGGTNLYRHKDSFYFLPTEDEWVKAAYWNGASIQTWATIDDSVPVMGIDSNYGGSGDGPWYIGSGSMELNGTFDMMGNVFEWIEDSWWSPERYPASSSHIYRGGSNAIYGGAIEALMSSTRYDGLADSEVSNVGFRIASIPEPATLALLGLGMVLLRKKD